MTPAGSPQHPQHPQRPQHPSPTTPPRVPDLAKAHEYAEKRDWPKYFQAVAGKGPRDTLLKALEFFDKEPPPASPRLAVDLGCGSGRDTLELLRRGWRVVATDNSPLGIDLLGAQIPAEHRPRLECRAAAFEDQEVPDAAFINASYCLPFCDPAGFPSLWARIVRAIPPRGRFAGQFFGDRDDWARLPDRSHHTRPQVERLLADFILERLHEVENYEAGVTGEIKNWHLFHVVARKRG